MRKLKTGVITKRDRKMSRLLAEQLEASYRQKVVCKICGHPDNDWPDRHGLCSDCFCGWLNGKFAQGMKMSDAMKMVNELDDPEIIKDLQRSRKKVKSTLKKKRTKMKDHKAFNVEENQTIGREKWNLDDFIKNAAETAIEGRTDVSEQLGCFSTKQLALFCRCGYQKTQKTERKVREELMRRIEVGDRILAVSWDTVKSCQNVPDLAWREVTARNERMVRVDQGGWYSKNNICWMEMFAKGDEETCH